MRYHGIHLLGLSPVFCTEATKFLILMSQLGNTEDDILIPSLIFLDYSDILGFGPGSTRLRMVEQPCYSFRVESSLDLAQSTSYLIVGTFEVFDDHVVAGQGGDPLVAESIQIWCH